MGRGLKERNRRTGAGTARTRKKKLSPAIEYFLRPFRLTQQEWKCRAKFIKDHPEQGIVLPHPLEECRDYQPRITIEELE